MDFSLSCLITGSHKEPMPTKRPIAQPPPKSLCVHLHRSPKWSWQRQLREMLPSRPSRLHRNKVPAQVSKSCCGWIPLGRMPWFLVIGVFESQLWKLMSSAFKQKQLCVIGGWGPIMSYLQSIDWLAAIDFQGSLPSTNWQRVECLAETWDSCV